MESLSGKALRDLALGALAALLVAMAWVAFAAYDGHAESDGPLMRIAAERHLEIMAGLVAVSVVFGFAASQLLYTRLQESRKTSKGMLETVLLFLSAEERAILNHLVAHGGETTQAEISRLPRMTRVKAHRSLQKMQEKRILEIVPHGKVRRIVLAQHLRGTLMEPRS